MPVKVSVPRCCQIRNMAIMNPKSPIRLTMKAFLPGVGVHLVAEPEADQQVGAETDAFPADEHDREARPEHQHQHEHHEEVEVREVARVPRVFLHVADAEQVDQAADTGDDQEHHGGELVHLEGQVELERADRQPAPEARR